MTHDGVYFEPHYRNVKGDTYTLFVYNIYHNECI